MSPIWPGDGLTRLSRILIGLASGLVPASQRREWRDEWEAELWQLRSGRSQGGLFAFVVGAFWDGLSELGEGISVDTIMQDVRYAFRTLGRSPGFAAAAVSVLAVAIGASTAFFSVLESALLSDPPYPDADRIVAVDLLINLPDEAPSVSAWSNPRLQSMREEVGALRELAGYSVRSITLSEPGAPRVIDVEAVTPEYFGLLGVNAGLGRVFGSEEVDRGRAVLSAIVTRQLWRNELGGDPDVIGSGVTLDGIRFTIVGVVEDGFAGITGQAQMWIPMSSLREVRNDGMLDDAWNHHVSVVGRLGPDVPLETARAELAAFGATQMERYPAPVGAQRLEFNADAVRLGDARVDARTRNSMLALFGAVVLVLLIATTNLAGLLLARGARRQQEAAIRVSLGAGRGRLFRQMITESLVLAALGGGIGLALAAGGIDLLGAWLADSLGTLGSRGILYLDPAAFSINWRVLSFAILLTTGVGGLLGMIPAAQVSRTDPNSALKGGGVAAHSAGLPSLKGRNVMLVAQVAIALVLLVGASLMVRSMANLQRVDLGFDADNLLTAVYSISPADEAAGIDPALLHLEFADRVRALPGVTGAALGTVPMGGPQWTTIVSGSDGDLTLTAGDHLWMLLQPVDAGHMSVLGATLLEGRDIQTTDDFNTDKVIVLGRTAARRLFPDGDAVGQRIQLTKGGFGGSGARVVGVVEDMQMFAPGAPQQLLGYVSVRQAPELASGIMIRTSEDPESLIPALRGVLAELSPQTPLTSLMTMQVRASGLTSRSRAVTLVLAVFGVVALLLVSIGLYGMIAFMVSSRTRELGLRASLGADRLALAWLILGQGMWVSGLGIAIGVALSVAGSRFIESLLFETPAIDPFSVAAMSTLLLLISLAASLVPVLRAIRVDPVVALRRD